MKDEEEKIQILGFTLYKQIGTIRSKNRWDREVGFLQKNRLRGVR